MARWSRASTRVRTSSATMAALLVLAGCSVLSRDEPQPVPVPRSGGSLSPGPSPTTASSPSAKNDLDDDRLKRTFDAGDVTVNVDYTTPLPTKDWTPEKLKPLAVSLTAVVNSERGQKIYLTRVTVDSVVTDEGETLESPAPLVDTANISPGYIVTFPYTYAQVFSVPALVDGASQVRIHLTYEMLLQTDAKSADYQKQTATDTLIVPLS